MLYNELKKMRGRGGEELELLEAAQRDVVEARDTASQFRASLEQIRAENSQLLAEIETLRSVKNTVIHEPAMTQSAAETNNETPEDVTQEAARRSPLLKRTMAAGEAVMANVGTLKLYEILLGLVFISVIISWNPYV